MSIANIQAQVNRGNYFSKIGTNIKKNNYWDIQCPKLLIKLLTATRIFYIQP